MGSRTRTSQPVAHSATNDKVASLEARIAALEARIEELGSFATRLLGVDAELRHLKRGSTISSRARSH